MAFLFIYLLGGILKYYNNYLFILAIAHLWLMLKDLVLTWKFWVGKLEWNEKRIMI